MDFILKYALFWQIARVYIWGWETAMKNNRFFQRPNTVIDNSFQPQHRTTRLRRKIYS